MHKKFLLIFFLNQVLFANNCYNIRTNKDLPKLIIKNIKNIINREQSKIEYSYEKELIMKGIIKKAIQPFGYINPSISLKMPKQSCGLIIANIKLNQPTIVKKIFLNDKDYNKTLTLKKNSIFTTKKFNTSIIELYKRYKDIGYKNIDLSKTKVIIDPKSNLATVNFKAKFGPKFYFGEISIEQGSINKELIKKYINIKKGDPYSVSKVQELQESLRASGYFKTVDVNLPKINGRNYIPVNIKTSPNSKVQMVLGLGYDSLDSIKAIFNSKILVNAYGHVINTLSNISKNNIILQMQYQIPSKKHIDDNYKIQTSYLVDNIKKDKSLNLSASFTSVTKNSSTDFGISAINNHQITDTNDIVTNMVYPYFYVSEKNSYYIKNHQIKDQWDVSGMIAKKGIASNLNLIQVKGSYKKKITLNEKVRIITAAKLGINLTSDPTKQPLPTLLSLGGNNGLRGYPLNSIINRSDNFQILRALSFETQRKILDNTFITTFLDMGQVSKNLHDSWLHSLGFGIVYATALGDINVNIAKPLDKYPGIAKNKFRLSISYSI